MGVGDSDINNSEPTCACTGIVYGMAAMYAGITITTLALIHSSNKKYQETQNQPTQPVARTISEIPQTPNLSIPMNLETFPNRPWNANKTNTNNLEKTIGGQE